jgi:phospholipase/carboxylesterase
VTEALLHEVREPRSDADGALVLLHGRGADEHDLFPLLDHLDPNQRLLGICPRGPLALPPGGAHWYIVRSVGYPDPETFGPTFDRLSGWLDAFLAERGIDPSRTVIAGFSQGAVMSYALSLAASRPPPAAIVAMSGFIPTVEGFEIDLEGRKDVPVAIGHGIHDPVISVEFGRDARARLEQAGFNVTYRESPMAHTIDPAFLLEARAVVEEALP